MVAGWFSYKSLTLDLFPKVDMPVVTVTTTLPGAGPEEMEAQVTKPIEEVIKVEHPFIHNYFLAGRGRRALSALNQTVPVVA